MARREPRPSQRLIWLAGPVAAAVGLVVALLTWWIVSPGPATAPQIAVAPQPELQAVVPDPPASVLRAEPAGFARLVAPADWGGEVSREGRVVRVAMQRGFVAAAFVGGRGRRLEIRTPTALVEVIGTRFFVEVGMNGATSVGVAEGRVRVRSGGETRAVAAGEVRHVREDGSFGEAPAVLVGAKHVEDPYLVELEARTSRAVRPVPSSAPEAQRADGVDVLTELEAAERAANDGRAREAAAIYRACAGSSASAYASFRTLCALELARLLAFELDDGAGARRLLKQLRQRAEPEVRRQAELANCELDLRTDPCAAAACLGSLAAAGQPDATLRREAKRLIGRWKLGARECGGE